MAKADDTRTRPLPKEVTFGASCTPWREYTTDAEYPTKGHTKPKTERTK